MALDEPTDTDEEFEVDGYKYIVNKEFLAKAQPIKVDFHMYGFKLDCNMAFAPAGAGCSCSTDQKNRCGC
jgi:iron-sulfur cluster assembly protein